jgi:MoxR-like ATPase
MQPDAPVDPADSAADPAADPATDAAADPAALADALDAAGYLPDRGLATAAFLALRMGRPLFLEGDPGVGKTALAQALAEVTRSRLIRLQCYEGIDAAQALYDWDFPRQILHLRAAADSTDRADLEASLYDRRYLIARPILQALEQSPATLLIDEIDRADDEFEAFLLEVLADNAVTIPELGTIAAAVPPLVVITSNRTREVHDALKRRCLYHWVAHPDFGREVAIVRRRVPEAGEQLVRDVAGAVARLREANLLKPPGIAETIDWARALHVLGAERLDADSAEPTLGAVLKYHEDLARVRRQLDTVLGG